MPPRKKAAPKSQNAAKKASKTEAKPAPKRAAQGKKAPGKKAAKPAAEARRRDPPGEGEWALSRESRSHEKFMHGIKVPMAKNYIDNLSGEVQKGLRTKAAQGEYPIRRSILSEIGELRCRDLKAAHFRAVLRKLASTGLSYESVSKVKCAMGDMVKRMVAEEYLTANIAAGLKTPKTARRSDRSRLRRVTLAEYLRAWRSV